MMWHPAICDPVSLSAAFAVGVAGSLHCLAMCGGISGALGLRARRAATARRAGWLNGCHQLGRLTSYTTAGAAVGASGGLIQGVFGLDRIALVGRILAGVVLIGIGIGVLFKWRPLSWVERLGGQLWRYILPLTRSTAGTSIAGALFLGMVWGWLPCGFIYSMLIFAALKGGAAQGALLMASFGLGTTPAVLGAGLAMTGAGRLGWVKGLNTTAGWMLLMFGALTIIGPLSLAPR